MEIFLIIIFIVGYLAIAFEHPIKIDKAASALVMGGIIWGALALGIDELVTKEFLTEFYEKFKTKFNSLKELGFYSSDEYAKPIKFLKYELSHHLVDIGEILFFLLAAMTIVELVDSHQGFSIITDKITTKRKVPLMWILCVISFFFSAVLDNLTTSIVMAALISKMIKDKKDLEKIILCDVPNKIYPEIEKTFLNLVHNSGHPEIKLEKKVDFHKLYKERFN